MTLTDTFNGDVVHSNDNWQDDPTASEVQSTLGRSLGGSTDAGFAITLDPGVYVARLSSKNGKYGNGIVAINDFTPSTNTSTNTSTSTSSTLNTLTVTGPSRVAGTYTVSMNTGVGAAFDSLIIGWFGGGWGSGGPSPNSLPAYWLITVTVPKQGGSASNVTLIPNTSSETQFECGNLFGTILGDCGAVVHDATRRTVTFQNAELVGPAIGDVIYVTGTLTY